MEHPGKRRRSFADLGHVLGQLRAALRRHVHVQVRALVRRIDLPTHCQMIGFFDQRDHGIQPAFAQLASHFRLPLIDHLLFHALFEASPHLLDRLLPQIGRHVGHIDSDSQRVVLRHVPQQLAGIPGQILQQAFSIGEERPAVRLFHEDGLRSIGRQFLDAIAGVPGLSELVLQDSQQQIQVFHADKAHDIRLLDVRGRQIGTGRLALVQASRVRCGHQGHQAPHVAGTRHLGQKPDVAQQLVAVGDRDHHDRLNLNTAVFGCLRQRFGCGRRQQGQCQDKRQQSMQRCRHDQQLLHFLLKTRNDRRPRQERAHPARPQLFATRYYPPTRRNVYAKFSGQAE